MVRTVQRARALRKVMTPPELALWFQLRALRNAGWNFRRQSPEGRYILDFVCRRAKLIVEIDGGHHDELSQAEHDRIRGAYLEERGFRIMRFAAHDALNAIDGVMRDVCVALDAGEMPLVPDSAPDSNTGARYRRLVRLGLRRRD